MKKCTILVKNEKGFTIWETLLVILGGAAVGYLLGMLLRWVLGLDAY